MFYKKGGGDIWSILTLNDVFFLGKMEKTRVAEGGFTYSHNIISIYHPKWWFFGEDQKCSWGPKMKNKPNFFFLITGVSQTGGVGGGDPPLENFSHIIQFFFLRATHTMLVNKYPILKVYTYIAYMYVCSNCTFIYQNLHFKDYDPWHHTRLHHRHLIRE